MINNPDDFHLHRCFFLNLLHLQGGFFCLFIFTHLSSPVDQLYSLNVLSFERSWGFLEALLSLLGLGEGVGGQRCYSSVSGVERYAEGHRPAD